MGIQNYVIRPQNWDELGRGVKTDKTDALALVLRLDRLLAGNTKALAVIRVPTEAEEQARSAEAGNGNNCANTASAWKPKGAVCCFTMAAGFAAGGGPRKTGPWSKIGWPFRCKHYWPPCVSSSRRSMKS